MKVMLINLDRDADRLAAADAQLKGLGIAYERLSAVDARAMPLEEKRAAVNAFRWWCAIGRPVRDGEIGCALSHFKAWEAMGADEAVCVLEDDVVLDPRFSETLANVARTIDVRRPQVVLLSNHSAVTDFGNGFEGFRSAPDAPFSLAPSQFDLFTEGYVITRKAAEAIRRANCPLQTPCDHWGRWVRQGHIELFHAIPTVCSQNKAGFASSTVDPGQLVVADLSPVKWVGHKLKRLVGVALDRLLTF